MAACASAPRTPYYGDWRVLSFSAPGISATSANEAAKWVGARATYAKDRAAFGPDECRAPTYTSRTLTAQDFVAAYRVRADALGLTDPTVTIVTVSCRSAWTNRGSLLIVKSATNLITTWDGVFYELERRTP